LTGAVNADSVLKLITSVEVLASLVNYARVGAYGLARFYHVQFRPGEDERGLGVACRERKKLSRRNTNSYGSSRSVETALSLNTQKTFRPSPRPDQLPGPFKNGHHWRAPKFSAAYFRRPQIDLVPLNSKKNYAAPGLWHAYLLRDLKFARVCLAG
jgi:hypothetical protein